MSHIHSFAPIADPDAHTLILGSIPGKVSLLAGKYYAHPRNAFWKIITTLFNAKDGLAYDDRADLLISHGIALWDVLQSCTRESSLDSDIDEGTIITNDFVHFFESHPQISTIYFNGAKAEHLFSRYVLPGLEEGLALNLHRLPSTSPANASYSFSEKLDAWQIICATD
ncbi:MAG: DNA-deoxyinosine glycosylase [Gammaproteobacteria bacterium]|nr:DNA-deoxyinosine glycosylase [Gammaproteobacteria bacterium]